MIKKDDFTSWEDKKIMRGRGSGWKWECGSGAQPDETKSM